MESAIMVVLLILANGSVIPNSSLLEGKEPMFFKTFSRYHTGRNQSDNWRVLQSSMNAISKETLHKKDSNPFGHSLDRRKHKILKMATKQFEEPLEDFRLSQKLRQSASSFSTVNNGFHAANYNFRYQVKNNKASYGHQEIRKNQRVTGTYYVDLPNGMRQIVKYYADETGYHPSIKFVPINETTMPNATYGSPSLHPPSINEIRYYSLNFPSFDMHKPLNSDYYGFGLSFPSSKPTSISNIPTHSTTFSPTVPSIPSSKNEIEIGKISTPMADQTTEFPPQIIDPEFIRKKILPSNHSSATFPMNLGENRKASVGNKDITTI